MRYEGITCTGQCIALGKPFRATLTMDENQPADAFTGVFADQENLPDLLHLRIYRADGALLFGGIVDEQCRQVSGSGRFLKLEARSMAAVLLDNEVKPQTYVNPSLKQLFADHGAPYGLPSFKGDEDTYNWTYVVRKGSSAWQVFWDFCLYCHGIAPKVTPEGVLDVTGTKVQGVLRFSNTDGIAYTALTHNRSPEKRLSQLWLQQELGDGYTSNLMDLSAVQSGIQRTRYVTAANWQGRRTLKESRRRSDELVLVCPGGLCGEVGMQAEVEDPVLGSFRNYSAAKIVYELDSDGEQCTVTLRTDL